MSKKRLPTETTYTTASNTMLTQTELHIYGSSRLGVMNINRPVDNLLLNTTGSSFVRGIKNYELSHHLGNVLAVISDRKIAIPSSGNSSLIGYYEADVLNANDYYPFGMVMPGRTSAAGSAYRYGFNGQEKSDEIGEGFTTALFWEYDGRVGRRWNVDPKGDAYTSPYATFGNNPIAMSDRMGDSSVFDNRGRNLLQQR